MGGERTGCFTEIVFLVIRTDSAHGAVDWSAVCDCGASLLYSFFIVIFIQNMKTTGPGLRL